MSFFLKKIIIDIQLVVKYFHFYIKIVVKIFGSYNKSVVHLHRQNDSKNS
nr:MAG TPA: hypothetical protein [Caudoviricetes sp.]